MTHPPCANQSLYLWNNPLYNNNVDNLQWLGFAGSTADSRIRYPVPPATLNQCIFSFLFLLWRCDPTRVMAFSFLRFLDHTQRRTTVGRTPQDEWSARRRDLCMTTQHSQQTNIHAPGGIRTHDLSRRAAADVRLRPCGHWDRRPM